jgi:hypothetical protein
MAFTSLRATNNVGAFQLEVFDDVLLDERKPVLRESAYDTTVSRAGA